MTHSCAQIQIHRHRHLNKWKIVDRCKNEMVENGKSFVESSCLSSINPTTKSHRYTHQHIPLWYKMNIGTQTHTKTQTSI